jgi:hypothetical protein
MLVCDGASLAPVAHSGLSLAHESVVVVIVVPRSYVDFIGSAISIRVAGPVAVSPRATVSVAVLVQGQVLVQLKLGFLTLAVTSKYAAL